MRLDVPPQTIQRLFKIDKRTERYPNVTNEVAADAGIDKPLSSHWGRRTVAVMFANHHVPYEIVAKILGHGNVSTTAEFYARILDSSVIEAMKKAGLDSPAL